ncbi:hypothetical protein H8E52_03565 [bacterium]|nr:hypothetical protein [bacterium]
MKKAFVIASLIIAFAGISFAALANIESEKEISWDDLPRAVQLTILEAAGGNEILEIEEIRKGDGVFYEADWIEGGEEIEVQVALDGVLLSREVEIEDGKNGDDEDSEESDED